MSKRTWKWERYSIHFSIYDFPDAPARLEDEQYEQSLKRGKRARGADSIGTDDGQVDVVDDNAVSPRRGGRRGRPAADDQFIEESVEARIGMNFFFTSLLSILLLKDTLTYVRVEYAFKYFLIWKVLMIEWQ